jgi:glycogen(starch) synthase
VKILHTIYDDVDNPWCGGGGAVRAIEINRRLAKHHEVKMMVGNYPGAPRDETKHGIHIARLGSSSTYALSRLSFSLQASIALAKEKFDLWVYNFSAFSPILASARLRRRCVLEFFHILADHAVKKRPFLGLPAILMELYTLKSYTHLVGISPSVIQQIKRLARGKYLNLVYTGVDPSCFGVQGPEQDYILYFGRLDTYTKGIDLLLKAFSLISSKYPGVRLVLAGRGTSERIEELRSLCLKLGSEERVEILGPVSDSRKQALFGGALFNCMPSRYEGWGIAAIEAGAAEKAIIGTRIPGLTDAIQHNTTGLLVPPEDIESLANAMDRLLADPRLRNRLGSSGRKWAQRFTWDRVTRDQELVYEKILATLECQNG